MTGPLAIVLCCCLLPADEPDAEPLAMTPAVACKTVDGYELFEPLPKPALTADEKLLVYYRPRRYAIRLEDDGRYLAHFVQDVRVRRRGRKDVLWSKPAIVDYKARSDRRPEQVYLTNTIALKGWKPGEYDLDIILHDRLAEGSKATQTLRFEIVPAAKPAPADGPDRP